MQHIFLPAMSVHFPETVKTAVQLFSPLPLLLQLLLPFAFSYFFLKRAFWRHNVGLGGDGEKKEFRLLHSRRRKVGTMLHNNGVKSALPQNIPRKAD